MHEYTAQHISAATRSDHHLHSIPEVEGSPPPVTRSRLLGAQLGYADRGKLTFPCEGKRPLTRHGFKDATTDPRRIHMWRSRWPLSNIGLPTGERSGVWVLDVDRPEALDELEARIGRLPATARVRTPRGGLHLYFRHVEGITNSIGGLPKGIDVRGEGGYVLVPPSAGYSWEDRSPAAEAPPELVELVREKGPKAESSGTRNRKATPVPEGEIIPEGRRNNELARVCGRLHDGTRDLGQLTADLLAANVARCEPPMPEREVEKIARSIHQKAPCRSNGGRGPEVDEVLDASGLHWYERYLPKSGRGKLRDTFRSHLISAGMYGRLTTVEIDGETRRAVSYTESCRDLAITARTSPTSVSRNNAKLREMGALSWRSGNRRDRRSTTYLIVEPRRSVTHTTTSSLSVVVERNVDEVCNGTARPPRPDRLRTRTWWMRDVVGNARGGTLDALEAFGWQTREELAERVGYSRPRDLERKHLRPLAEMGLVESRDGRWGVAHDYADAQAGIAELNPEVIRREYSSSEGRTVSTVAFLMSSVERDRRAERGVRESRERFAEYLKNTSPESDDACRELLNEVEREREHLEAEIRRVAAADGTTGEIEPADLYRRLVLAGINAKHADRHLESLGFDPAWIPGLDSPVSEGHPDGSLTEQKATGRVA